MILIFHPKYNDAGRAEEDEDFTKEAHTSFVESIPPSQTLVFGDSQVSSDYHSLSKHSKAPSMIGGQLSPANDSAFQFGPLPIPPPESDPYNIHPYKVYSDDPLHKAYQYGMSGREEDSVFSNGSSANLSNVDMSDPYLSYPQPITKNKPALVPISGYKIERPMAQPEPFPSKSELDSFATYNFP
jgi:hypothetical protein